jgi:hypothetical protein
VEIEGTKEGKKEERKEEIEGRKQLKEEGN